MSGSPIQEVPGTPWLCNSTVGHRVSSASVVPDVGDVFNNSQDYVVPHTPGPGGDTASPGTHVFTPSFRTPNYRVPTTTPCAEGDKEYPVTSVMLQPHHRNVVYEDFKRWSREKLRRKILLTKLSDDNDQLVPGTPVQNNKSTCSPHGFHIDTPPLQRRPTLFSSTPNTRRSNHSVQRSPPLDLFHGEDFFA